MYLIAYKGKGELYTNIGVGLSALLVSTTWAMREPLLRGTSDRTGSTFFCVYGLTFCFLISVVVAKQNAEMLYGYRCMFYI